MSWPKGRLLWRIKCSKILLCLPTTAGKDNVWLFRWFGLAMVLVLVLLLILILVRSVVLSVVFLASWWCYQLRRRPKSLKLLRTQANWRVGGLGGLGSQVGR